MMIVPMFSTNQKNELAINHQLQNKLTVVPDTMLRGYDPITIFFPSTKGPTNGGPLDTPGNTIRIKPPHPGETKWLDAKTLQFLPTTHWPALERFSITVDGKKLTISTLMAPPRRLTPSDGSKNLEPIKEFNLAFANPIALEKLSMMITFQARPLPGVTGGKEYWLTSKDFIVKEMERASITENVRYRVTLHKPIPYGMLATMHLRLSLDNNIPGSLARYNFSTKPLFRLTGIGSGSTTFPVASKGSVYPEEQAMDCGTGKGMLTLQFSDQPGTVTVAQIKRMVRFSPSVKNLRHDVYGNNIRLYFDAVREKAYALELQFIPFKSNTNRQLAPYGPTSLYFFYRRQGSFLKWLSGHAILERYGPQVFAMEGRNLDQIDLRLYKVNPKNRNFWPFPDSPIAVDESKRPPGPGEEPEYARALRKHITLQGSPLVSKVVPLPLETGTGRIKFGLDLKPHMARISGPNQPGSYLAGFRIIGSSTQRQYVRMQVTDICLTTVEEEAAVTFVVTSMKNATPISGASVVVEGQKSRLDWVPVVSGITDSNGRFRFRHTHDIDPTICRISVTNGLDTLVLDPNKPPPNFMNNHWYNSYSKWLGWLNSDPRSAKSDSYPKAHILTERPVYRPEEVVHIKGYVRQRMQGNILSRSQSTKKDIVVDGPGGKRWTYPVTITTHGSFYCKFAEKDLPTGEYRASINHNGHKAFVNFKKESYRIPRFEVDINGPDRVALDEPFQLDMLATYYAGGPVVGQSANWQVMQYPYRYSMPGYEGFLFSSDERFSGRGSAQNYDTISKNDISDDKGSSYIKIDPTTGDDTRSRKYIVECTVRGADEQTVTATHSVLALSPFSLGLKLERFLGDGMAIKPQVVIVGYDGKPIAGKKFHLKLMQRQWHSHLQESDFSTGKAKYVTDVVDETIFQEDYVSEDGKKEISLPVKESGVYVIEIAARDKQGRLQKVQADLYVAGKTPVSWKKPKANIFETTSDKGKYLPGDTAKILLKSPFQEAHALVVVEGPSANRYHWVDIHRGQGIFNLKIEGDMTPRIPIHFLLMRGRLPGKNKKPQAGRVDRAKPISMGSTVWLRVEPRDNQLKLKLDHPEKNLPGAKIEIKIAMTDPDGKPLDGEVALWLVDRAVLALGKEKRLNPLPSFIDPVKSFIRIRDTRNLAVGNLPHEVVAGGDGAEMAEPSIFDKVTVRRNFKTVPYYNPVIIVKNGIAEVEVQLPDNLTDFAVRAVATDGGGRFGAVKSRLSIRLPLIVQPALPRFVRPGDTFTAGGIGRVVEGEPGPGSAELQVEGLQVSGDTKTKISWAKGKPEKVFFPFRVPIKAADRKDPSVTVRLAVKRDTDAAMDAFELKLPVKRDKSSFRSETFVILEPGKTYSFPTPKRKIRPGTMRQTLLLTPEPALVKMLAALNYLARYPHGCTEQRISKLLPELTLKSVMDIMGRKIHAGTIKSMMKDTLTYLESCLKSNGLYSYWPGSRGYVGLTAYVVEFLLEAQKAGFKFKPKLLDRAVAALKESLRTDYSHFISGFRFVERAEALTALASAGFFEMSYAHDLTARALSMDLYSESKILHTLLNHGPSYKKGIQRLSGDLWKSMIFKLRDGKEAYGGLQYRGDGWGGQILSSESKTIANVARALFKAEPQNKRVRLLMSELINLGTGDGWGSTNANAAALIALGDLMKNPQAGDYIVEAAFGETTRKIETKGKVVTRIMDSGNVPGTFKLVSGIDKPLMAMVSQEYVVAGTGDTVKAVNDGFVVNRRLLAYEGEGQPTTKYKAEAGKRHVFAMGTVVEEHVQVINSEDRFYVAIRAPFAAGFEPMNPNLATSPPEAKPAGSFSLQPDYAIYADDSVTFYFDALPKGTYDFYFRLRASVEGKYSHPPARAELMYHLPTYGNSDGVGITIEKRAE
ncbi:MAG: hypothetical protein GY765_02795 [bacterium]|nr:hypothetical protein [bacterium]